MTVQPIAGSLWAKADLAAGVKGRVKEAKEERKGVDAIVGLSRLVRPASIACCESGQGDCDP